MGDGEEDHCNRAWNAGFRSGWQAGRASVRDERQSDQATTRERLERVRDMLARRESGQTYREIGLAWGVSASRVQQIIERAKGEARMREENEER